MRNKTIHIFSLSHLNPDGSLKIGGYENYVENLACIFADSGYCVYLHEVSGNGKDFLLVRNGFTDIGYSISGNFKKTCVELQKKATKSKYFEHNDLVIWTTDYMALYNKCTNAIAIQHGIAWDIPHEKKSFLNSIKALLQIIRKTRIINKVKKMVCVDYNYWNWIKASAPFSKYSNKLVVIPNFAIVPKEFPKRSTPSNKINICFARRFETYRGTRLMKDAIFLLSNEPNFDRMSFYFAGNGSDEEYLKSAFINFNNVFFTSYSPQESYEFHSDMDIAVIPTIGSEGTSLSALEAMASGCALITTAVGGLSNIIIDEYNGLITEDNCFSLAKCIKELVDDSKKRLIIAQNGWNVVDKAFSVAKWKKDWLDLVATFFAN